MLLIAISAVIIAYNEHNQLSDCLESLDFVDDIVLIDSFSEDKTADIARQFGARIIQQKWLGFGSQKQFAVKQAKHDWVLCLDADERISTELKRSLIDLQLKPDFAYNMPRRNRFMGRWLYHGEGYPDLSLRLFNRQDAQWSDDMVHEKVITKAEVMTLKGDLLHESEQSLHQYLAKQNHYTSLQAQQLYQQNKSVSAGKLLFSPLFRFIRLYVFHRGFLDGLPGLIHILIGCFNSFTKYAKLTALNSNRVKR